ncbi:LysR family transcriptional regulator [Sulfitobacter sp.]|jgi:DNA-binding transcriptional LysR family regulator|uniref:LysR family transcriptional regulator n=1 Tax=Sulfitobacter sp. TaxID=1903071 RepID=UPI003EF881B4
MKLQQLRYFVAVYESGSFSAAAERVSATQSGLSMHVSQMEKRYDVTLFTRSSSGVTPTETGNSFYKEAVKVLAIASNAEDTLRYLSKAVVGHISVGLMPTFTRSVLTNVLLRFSEEYSEVRVTISEAFSGDLAEAVSAGRLDFAVVPSIIQNDAILGTPMGRDQECFVCAAGSHPSIGPTVRLKDLPPQRIVVPGWTNTRRARIEQYLTENGIVAQEILEIDTMYGTLDLVARSDWVSILPGILCVPDLDGRKRRVMPLADPAFYVDYLRIEPRSKPLSRAAQAFADILQEELNSTMEIPLVSER